MMGIVAFLFVRDPLSIQFYLVFAIIEVGNSMENIAIEQTFSKFMPSDIRGCLSSLQFFIQSIGLMILAKVTGKLYDQVGYWLPFVIIGGCDLCFALLIIGLALAGKYKY